MTGRPRSAGSPRKPRSVWSDVNRRRAEVLLAEGRMTEAGIRAYERREEGRSGIYSYEQRELALDSPYVARLLKNKAARKFWESEAPSYRKAAIWWVVSAKTEATRDRRLATLIADSAAGRRIGPMIRK